MRELEGGPLRRGIRRGKGRGGERCIEGRGRREGKGKEAKRERG